MFAESVGNNLLKKIPGCENMFIAPNGEIRERGNISGRQAGHMYSGQQRPQTWPQNSSDIINPQNSGTSRPQLPQNTNNQQVLQQYQPWINLSQNPFHNFSYPPYHFQGYPGNMQHIPPPHMIPFHFAPQYQAPAHAHQYNNFQQAPQQDLLGGLDNVEQSQQPNADAEAQLLPMNDNNSE